MQYFLQASPELLFGLQLIIFRGTLRFTRIIHLLSPQNPHTGPGITNLPRPRAKQNTMWQLNVREFILKNSWFSIGLVSVIVVLWQVCHIPKHSWTPQKYTVWFWPPFGTDPSSVALLPLPSATFTLLQRFPPYHDLWPTDHPHQPPPQVHMSLICTKEQNPSAAAEVGHINAGSNPLFPKSELQFPFSLWPPALSGIAVCQENGCSGSLLCTRASSLWSLFRPMATAGLGTSNLMGPFDLAIFSQAFIISFSPNNAKQIWEKSANNNPISALHLQARSLLQAAWAELAP